MLEINIAQYKTAIRNIPAVIEDQHMLAFDFLEDSFKAAYCFHTTHVDIHDGESAFNDLFLYSFLKTVCKAIVAEIDSCKIDFKPGEATLEAMKCQVKSARIGEDEKYYYKADGLIKLYGMKKLEILLMETSNFFGCKDKSKHSFDHHKGVYGIVVMLKVIAENRNFGTISTFKKIKVFFLHAAGKSLRFEPNGSLYELWLDDSLLIQPEFEEKSEALPKFINFY
ncbi:MAG: hypothetical protein EXX96DRAFT_622871 [Benjaminiella poitrasii]|nr:MAG: hypothetical protein EXX96DRAFT_622871 [Benjaminiella poitrasii]